MADLTELIGKQTLIVEDLRRRIRELEDQAAKEERATLKAELTKKKLSDKERDEIRVIFDEYDTDKSGTLDPREVSECAAKLGAKMTTVELDAAVRALDTNKDGKISFDEFVEWFTSDSKLGGLSSSKLIAVRLKMRLQKVKRSALSHMRTVDRSEGFGHSFSIRTNRPFDSKFNVSATAIPMPAGMSVASPGAREVLPDFDWSTPETTSVARIAVVCDKPAELIAGLKNLLPSDMVGGTIDEADPRSVVLYVASDDMEIPYLTAFGTQPIAVSIDTPHNFKDLAAKTLTEGVISAFSEFSVNVTASINPQVNFIALVRQILTGGTAGRARGPKNKLHPLVASLVSRGGSIAVSANPIQHTIAHQASQLIAAGIKHAQKINPEADVSFLQTPEFATFIERSLELSYAPNIRLFLLQHFTDDFDCLEDESELNRRYKHINRATEILHSAGVSDIQTITISTNTNVITFETPGLDVKYALSLLPEGEGKNGIFSRKTLADIKAHFALPTELKHALIPSGSPLHGVVSAAAAIANIGVEEKDAIFIDESSADSDSIDLDRPARGDDARLKAVTSDGDDMSMSGSSCETPAGKRKATPQSASTTDDCPSAMSSD